MFNLFNKKKVFAGKQNNDEKKPAAAAAGAKTDAKNAKPAPFAALGKTWAKLNKMDRKQAYTWGAVAVVALVALITLGSVVGGGNDEDFAAFETRGYDLANMPFSSDEAEQYLLASKYPDMQNTNASGLYSKAEKEARQAEDAEEAAAQLDTSVTSEASEYVPGRYYGGSSSGPVTPTQVGTLNSASLKGASGSGVSGTFGPSGDFSNFRSQDKGRDVFNAQQGRGSGNARQALFQTAVGSRAAAGQKDNRLVNAKKAMMGGNIKGSDAFLSDSGAVDLSKAAGLNLDTNAPVSSVDPGLFDDALKDAQQQAEDTAQEEDENRWWKEQLLELGKWAVQQLFSWGMGEAQGAIDQARQLKSVESQSYLDTNQQIVDEWANYNAAQQDLETNFDGDLDAWSEAHNNATFPSEPTVLPAPQASASSIDSRTLDSIRNNGKAQRNLGLKYNEETQEWLSRKTGDVVKLETDGSIDLTKNGIKVTDKRLTRANDSIFVNYAKNTPLYTTNAETAKTNFKLAGGGSRSTTRTTIGYQEGEIYTRNGRTYKIVNGVPTDITGQR